MTPKTPAAPKRAPQNTPRFALNGRMLSALVLIAVAIGYWIAFFSVEGMRLGTYEITLTQLPRIDEVLFQDLPEIWVDRQPENAAWLDRLPVYGVAFWIIVSAAAIGWLTLPLRCRQSLDGLEQVVFSTGIGLTLLSLFTLTAGLAGWLHMAALWIGSMTLAIVVAAGKLVLDRLRMSAQTARPAPPVTRHSRWWWIALLPFAVWPLLEAATPPVEFDVRSYHLQVPKEWFQQGYIGFLPHNVYGNMPLGAETLALLAMVVMPEDPGWWYGAIAGKVVIACFTLLAALSLYTIGRRFFHATAGMVAAVIYLSTPWTVFVSTTGLIDGAVGCYLLLSVHATLLWMQRHQWLSDEPAATTSSHTSSLSFTALIGFFAGAAAGCKYTGVVFAVIPLGIVLLVLSRRARWKELLVFATAVLVACGLWYGKNAVLAGNPTYPLLYNVFGGRAWDEATNQRWTRVHSPQADSHGNRFSFQQLLTSLSAVGLRTEQLNPLLFSLAPLGLLVTKNRRAIYLALALVGFYFVAWWLLTHRFERFFVPAYALVALMAGVGYTWSSTRAWRIPASVLVGLTLLVNFLIIASGGLNPPAYRPKIFVALETLRRDPQRVSVTQLYLNKHAPRDQAVLVVGDAEVFDLEMPIYYSTCWNATPFELWMKDRTAEERLQLLAEHNVSHIYVHWAEIARYLTDGNYGFTTYVTPPLLRGEMRYEQKLIEPLPIPAGETLLPMNFAEVFLVQYGDSEPGTATQ